MASGEYGEGGKSPTPNPSKRPRTDQLTEELIPRFLVVKRKDGKDFSTTNPFLISKVLHGLIGDVNNVKKIREGLLIETKTQKQAKRLTELEKFNELEVTISPHRSLNISKGVINCRDLLNCTEEEICKELKSQGVIEARRISTKKNGTIINTASIILTFNREKLPNKVYAAMYSLPVRTYIPNPMRCYTCQKFGHTSKNCTKTQICACGEPPHEGAQCSNAATCVNCQGNHIATSRECPKYKEELEIIKHKTVNRCTFKEAKEYVTRNTPRYTVSYAEVASKTMASTIPPISDFAATLIPQIKKIVEETIALNLTNIVEQIINAVKQTLPITQQNTNTTLPVKTIPKPATFLLPKMQTRASEQKKITKEVQPKACNLPTTDNNATTADATETDTSGMSVDEADLEAARQKKDKRRKPKR